MIWKSVEDNVIEKVFQILDEELKVNYRMKTEKLSGLKLFVCMILRLQLSKCKICTSSNICTVLVNIKTKT